MVVNIKKYQKLVLGILFILVLFYLVYRIKFDMSDLPKGDYLSSVDSPNGEYTLKAYLIDCGATCAYTLRVELVNNETQKVKNIYWQYRESEANMKWINSDIVEINDKKLNIKKNQFCKSCKD